MKIKEVAKSLRPCIITFVGSDKVGKSSIITEFRKITNHKDQLCDRGLVDCYVYAKLYKRDSDLNEYLKMIDVYLRRKDFVIVFVHCNSEIVKKRFEQHDETDMKFKDFEKHQQEFFKVYKKFSDRKNVMSLDTSVKIPYESAIELVEKIRDMQYGKCIPIKNFTEAK